MFVSSTPYRGHTFYFFLPYWYLAVQMYEITILAVVVLWKSRQRRETISNTAACSVPILLLQSWSIGLQTIIKMTAQADYTICLQNQILQPDQRHQSLLDNQVAHQIEWLCLIYKEIYISTRNA